MKPIVVRDSRVPGWLSIFVEPAAVTLWPFIFIAPDKDTENLIRHETIHIRQYNETLVLGFLLFYVWDWLHGLMKYASPKKAYRQIRMEQEAFTHAANKGYEDRRERWAWRRFKV